MFLSYRVGCVHLCRRPFANSFAFDILKRVLIMYYPIYTPLEMFTINRLLVLYRGVFHTYTTIAHTSPAFIYLRIYYLLFHSSSAFIFSIVKSSSSNCVPFFARL